MSGTVKKLYEIEQEQLKVNPFPDFQTGDTVGVYYKIREGEKERIQLFEGVCIQRHNGGLRSTFTIRKMSDGVGVERVFPLHSPRIDRLEVKMRGKVRQARLQYLRKLRGKSARIRERGTI
jgi:large subunit ribosomal protein L19